MTPWLRGIVAVIGTAWAACACAIAPVPLAHDLAFGDGSVREHALDQIVAGADATLVPVLQAFIDGDVKTVGEDRVLLVKDGSAVDLATGQPVDPVPDNLDDVVANNRFRGLLASTIAALRLVSPDRDARAAAARELADRADADMLPAIKAAIARETDPAIKASLTLTRASIELASSDRATRIAAIRALADSDSRATLVPLDKLVARNGNAWAEPDAEVRAAAGESISAIERRLAFGDAAGRLFTGISLGSILLLAALGLAITYGLMGVINMAHGELIMIGAYTTYVVQNLFHRYAPGLFDAYLVCAIPAAFAVSAAVGMLLERTVIRHLYGRPLETLLATWGLSLVLIQATRTIFGAQNVQVENPRWLAGGIPLVSDVVLPWNRIAIIVFAIAVLLGMWLLLARTRLGLNVRAVTQNRAMAGALGVPTARVDMLAFGLGSGIAGLAGCALSQVGNVGPDLGQSYIVDSFMVVVLGGVGQLMGTVYAALGLGIVNKLIEAWSGAVLAKIAILVFIIVFIQKRPQGLFAMKGRTVEA
jgi:urea transport system permease protein